MASTNPPPRPPIKVLSEAATKACMDVLDELGGELLDGEISIEQFEDEFKAEMKSAYIAQYLFGVGGLAYMTADDWAQVAVDLERQYKFADQYIDELSEAQDEDQKALLLFIAAGGDIDDEEALPPSAVAALLWRLGLYADSTGTVYEKAAAVQAVREGLDEELWNLDDGVENHCDECPKYADMDWQPIGTFPEPGDGTTPCGNRCHCWKTYRSSKSEE
jgi:hypothetical protein